MVLMKKRVRHAQRVYGLGGVELDTMLEEQSGKCPICGKLLRPYFIDHDHKTGKVRGLLCPSCNTGLGFFADSIERLLAAVVYLRKQE